MSFRGNRTTKNTGHSYFKIRLASYALQQGKLIAYPTEAVYGLGCDPLNETAVLNLLNLKQRPVHKGLILIASDFAQLHPFVRPSPEILNRIMPSWPGAITRVIPAPPRANGIRLRNIPIRLMI